MHAIHIFGTTVRKKTKITTNLITKYFQTDVSVIVIDIT